MRSAGVTEDIIPAVRYHLNEEIENESLILSEAGLEGDDTDIDAVVRSHIVEALDYVHKIAPPELLDGLTPVFGTDYTVTITDSVIPDIRVQEGCPMLRIFSLRAIDTPFNVREIVAEGSPQGHMQLKPYTRGTWDRPVLVMMADSENHLPHLKYYTLREEPQSADVLSEFLYIPKQSEGQDSYLISSQLYESTINYITGLVLNTYGEHDRAQVYFTRAENK